MVDLKFNKYKFFQEIKYTPHPGQKQFHDSKARFRIMTCGRRWGKSLSAAMECIASMIEKPNQLGWVVAPTYELSEKIFREVYWAMHRHLKSWIEKSSLSRGDMIIKLINGSTLIAKSADNPASLIGEGLDFLIMDEASRIKSMVWFEALRPTLTDKQGWAVFISTPRGKNWFYEMFQCGANDEVGYDSWSFTSYTNPHLKKSEIDLAAEKIPKMTFRQEYLAEFLESADSYFTYELVESCVSDSIEECNKRKHPKYVYYLGVDCARMGEDESVLIVIEQTPLGVNQVVHVETAETNTIPQLSGRAKALDSQFHFRRMFIDMTGLGAGVYDELNIAVPGRVEGVTFSVKVKQDIYSHLKVLMENRMIIYPRIRKMIEQLKDLRYEITPTGNYKIHHSEFGFDDYPDALALVAQGIQRRVYRSVIG